MQKPRRSNGFLTIVLLTSSLSHAAAGSDSDIAKVRAQLVAWYARQAPDAVTIRGYVRSLGSDGGWPDIDYTNIERSGWPVRAHMRRALAMAEAYRNPDHPLVGDAALRAAVLRSLENWVEKDYRNPNWWFGRIGIPQLLAPTLILMDDAVGPELRDKAVSTVLARSKMGMTGQNKVWVAGIALMKGLLGNDPDLVAKARAEIFSELHVTTAEGVQPDYSFHQHGPQLQWGNYGASFSSDMVGWASILRGTAFALDPPQVEVLRRYLLEGQAWVLWRGYMDISACGRQTFRNCQASKGRGILDQIALMAAFDPEHADAYARVIAANRPNADDVLPGHKHFWRSDISVHRRETWYASVKMSSKRVIGAETCNKDSQRGLHLGDGVTYFHRTGREYENLIPVWDWRRLPGTTCRQDTGSLSPSSKRCRGQSHLVGGVSDGRHGLAAMEYLRDGLRACKAWFFLDDAVVCLGAGIACPHPEAILTSVEQCALHGPVTISTDRHMRRLDEGESLSDRLQWAHHNSIGYVFLEPGDVTIRAQEQTGNWHDIHGREPNESATRGVFSLWIDHGSAPEAARYAYAVFPGVEASAVPALHAAPPVTILSQSPALQAIASADGALVQAAFFEAGRLTWGQRQSLEVDIPCLIILDKTGERTRLHVADPTHQQERLTMRLAGRYTAPQAQYAPGKGQTELTITLPQDGFAGQTVSVELR